MLSTGTLLQTLQSLDSNTPAVLVTVLHTRGSVPREAGTRMLITADTCHDTIGGGHLEWRAMAEARLWLHERNADPAQRERLLNLTLGASLGQCCGGALQLRLERVDFWTAAERAQRLQDLHAEQQAQTPLYLFGAGHVGQALVQVLQAVPGRIVWVDEREHLFPADVSPQVQCEATDIPEALIAAAPAGAEFLVMTHHHGLDLRLCEHILRRDDFAWFGLIGSATKRARFHSRLRQAGIAESELARMTCPVGIPGIPGKEPGVIAVAIAAQLLQARAMRPTLAPSFNLPESEHASR